MSTLEVAALTFAALPLLMVIWNSLAIGDLSVARGGLPTLSVLIPARDESATIATCIDAVLANDLPAFEIIVLDDHSSDNTAELVKACASRHPAILLEQGKTLPDGWTGKNFACAQLAAQAQGDWLLFIDADVRLAPQALAKLLTYTISRQRTSLISAVPRQETGSFFERLLIPLIPYLVMGYLPLALMRHTAHPAFAVATGQLLLIRRDKYQALGGHAAIRGKLHDGLQLARYWRRNGEPTDFVAGQSLANVRMYQDWRGTWFGLAKNAREGMAQPWPLLLWTLLLAGGHLLPEGLLVAAWLRDADCRIPLLACLLSLASRLLVSLPRRESLTGALLHPFGVILSLSLQFWACFFPRQIAKIGWRGRRYSA